MGGKLEEIRIILFIFVTYLLSNGNIEWSWAEMKLGPGSMGHWVDPYKI